MFDELLKWIINGSKLVFQQILFWQLIKDQGFS